MPQFDTDAPRRVLSQLSSDLRSCGNCDEAFRIREELPGTPAGRVLLAIRAFQILERRDHQP